MGLCSERMSINGGSKMKSKTYNGDVRSSKKDFETSQLGAFATPGLLLAQGPVRLTAESGLYFTAAAFLWVPLSGSMGCSLSFG
jgi:hypothetical protein